jgi:hypothetical protein
MRGRRRLEHKLEHDELDSQQHEHDQHDDLDVTQEAEAEEGRLLSVALIRRS